ncbi:aconitate hydratase AcnA [Streptomyces lavenduligriseus]|uniref:Aconitate hydratase n=1 Tax=Streptomyces lavenduligriseus TaxID=67315 RepID=A0ABT0NTC8_9ACTN|nr:aconitate hydratase AcnA [Streptomyces lavenduligriseus]MCL3994391.1 aconitate hydratase AcnA [Streptomyces lavenduligriseus]
MSALVRTRLAGREARVYGLPEFAGASGFDLAAVPYTGRVLLESLLRGGDTAAAAALGKRLTAGEEPGLEMPFRPARILVQDYTGIPLLVDLAALRDRVTEPAGVNPALPVDVVVDHSVQTDFAGRPDALARNEALERERNNERYAFLKWAEGAFHGLRVIPPGSGIVHQVNLERLATVVAHGTGDVFHPDTVIGTDSHTTMVNGLGVLGWGVGGLEAEALMLGLAQPVRIPAVVGVRLTGTLRPGVSPTDVVLALTERLRRENVRGLMLEFTGPSVAALSAPDRCTIANMAPEYGAMSAFFPVDGETLDYLRRTGRTEADTDLVAEYCRRQWLLRDGQEPRFGRVIEFDLAGVGPNLAGPSRPDQRISLAELPGSFAALHSGAPRAEAGVRDGDLVIASITSCTSTSNPRAMLAAGVLARRAVARGLSVPGHVKTSLAPGSRAVTRYLRAAGLLDDLERLGFHVTGYGCMTCNGGSGPLNEGVGAAVERAGLTVAAVLSGNRNFEARVHAQVRAGYLASPALVVALALVGHVRADLEREPLGTDADGKPVFLRDLWPDDEELRRLEAEFVTPDVFADDPAARTGWDAVPAPRADVFAWDPHSTYIRPPAYADAGPGSGPLTGVRVLLALGDDVSTDHISPVGAIPPASPAGRYLTEHGVPEREFNSYGSRRGNHEVMARGTFSNPRLRNRLVGDGDSGGTTLHLPTGERLPVYEAARRYAAEGTPLIVLAGRSYGMGSSRDWAAKGPWLLGVRAVLAESFERIHRANLCAMGILPLLLPEGRGWADLGLTGHEEFRLALEGVRETGTAHITAGGVSFTVRADVQSAGEWDVLLAGGTLPYLLRRLRAKEAR